MMSSDRYWRKTMESNKITDSSRRVINITLAVAAIIFVCCVVADIFGLTICRFVWSENLFYIGDGSSRDYEGMRFTIFVALFYLCTFLTYGILFSVTRLLLNIKKGIVFDKVNTRMMKYISAGCFAICFLCLGGMLIDVSLVIVAIVGAFVGLIVQCVRIVMDKAIDMQNELDLTI